MTEILLFFLLPLLLLLFLLLPILSKIAKYMSRTQVPEEDQRLSTVSDLKSYEPRPKAVVRTEGKNAAKDKLENFYWWDPDGEASNADGDEIIESNVSGYGNGEIDEGVWRRFVSPMSEARNQIDLKDSSSVTRDAGYSLLNARYTGKSAFWYKDVSDMALLRDLNFNDDGSKIYLNGTTNNIIEQYSLSTPYDISTNSFETRINTASDFDWSSYGGAGEDPVASDFVNGGSDLFFISQDANLNGGQGAVQKISLSTPYDLSSTTTADGGVVLSNIPSSIEFHPNDGSRFFSGDGKGGIEEYSLDGGAFDLSGGISRANLLDISSNVGNPRSFTFNGSGRAFFTTGFSSDKVYKFELGSAYDITGSVVLTETFDISETMTSPEFITFNGDGSNFFLGYTSSGKYYEFESTVSRIDVRNTLSGGDGISFDSKTGEIATTTTDEITEGSNSLYYTSERSQDELKIQGSGLSYEKNIEKAGVFGSAVYTGKSLDVTSEDEEPKGLTFNNDGSKLFVIGDDKQTIYEYDLSTEFDLSTASYSGTSLKVTSQLSNPRDITFNPDGTKMIAIGSGYSDVREYNLTTGFDLSTASYSGTSFDVYSEETAPRGLAFNSDGTKMFIIGTSSDSVHEYDLNTGFDISTASYSGTSFDVSGEEVFPIVLEFNGDGTKMFTLGYQSDSILQYDLTTGFDISTASFSGESFGPVSGETEAGLAFDSNDTKAFVIEENIFQYNLESKGALTLETSGDAGAVQRSTGSIDSGLVGNTSELYVNPNTGNVGIGTDSPNRKFSVDAGASDAVAAEFSTSEDRAYVDVNNQSGSKGTGIRHILGGSPRWVAGVDNTDNNKFKIVNAGNIVSGSDLVIDTSGNVGVGTDSPSKRIDLGSGKIAARKFVHTGTSAGEIPLAYRESRTLAATVDDYVEIGEFYVSTNYSSFKLTISEDSAQTSKQYLLPVANNQTNGNWREALPIAGSTRNSSDDFSLQVNAGDYLTKLRIRRSSVSPTSGSSMSLNITIQELGSKTDTFTSKSGTGSTSKKPLFGATVITQKDGKLGVGTNSPGRKLHVESDSGDVAAVVESSNDPYTWLSFVGPNSTSDTHTLIGNEGDDLLFRSGDNEQMRIDDTGQVGINTKNPSTKLEVDGDITTNNIIQKGGQLPQVYRETRSVPTTVDDYIEIGKFSNQHSASTIKVNITVSSSGFSTAKEYLLPIKSNQTTGNWRKVLPISEGVHSKNGTDQDFSLQVNEDGSNTRLRIRRSSGTVSGTAEITMQQLGLTQNSFTSQNGTGSTSKKPFFTGTVIKQKDGKVGISTSDPSKTLDVNGTINVSKNELITQSSEPVLSVDTGTNKSLTVGTAADTDINDGGGNFTGGNVFMGVYAGINSTTTGARNTAVGYYSGWDLQDGEGNACFGTSSGTYVSSGTFNTMIGDSAGFNTSTGGKNTFVGAEAGHGNDSGNGNTYLGRKTGRNVTGASRNIAIGHETMENASGKDIVAIGYRAGRSNSQDNQFILQNKNASTTPLIQGDFSNQQVGIGKSSPSKALDVAGQVTMDDTYIRNLSNVSSNTTTSGDDFYSVDTSGGSVTLTLSSSDAETGRVIHVKRNGTQKVTIDTQGSETIEGRSSAQLGSDEESVRLVYNGANSDWEVY